MNEPLALANSTDCVHVVDANVLAGKGESIWIGKQPAGKKLQFWALQMVRSGYQPHLQRHVL